MFYFDIDGLTYRVRFEHVKDQNGKYISTIAYLQSAKLDSPANDFFVIGMGIAYCSSKDQFCKETGRKLALQRLLSEVFQGRDKRKLVWQAYFARKQKPAGESEPVGC